MESSKIKNILNQYNQNQLLTFYDELNFYRKKKLIKDINKIDFKSINDNFVRLIVNENQNEIIRKKTFYNISPGPYYKKNEIDNLNEIKNIGENIIKNNETALVTLAGGMGSRLGHKGPKGTFELNINTKKISLFEIIVNNLKDINKRYNVTPYWFIMCSKNNINETKKYFKEKKYFNYPKKRIIFFIQDEEAVCDLNGKILLKDKDKVLFESNGNGCVFKKLKDYDLISFMKKNNINWIFFSGIDNVLNKPIDEIFLGLTIKTNNKIASKSISKTDELNKNYIFCKKDNKIYMLESSKINPDLTNIKENNRYVYRETNILNHIVNISKLEEYANMKLIYHDAKRKTSYMDQSGKIIIPAEPNSCKFEQYIYEAFYNEEDMLIYSIENNEFSPLKTIADIKTVEKDYTKKINE